MNPVTHLVAHSSGWSGGNPLWAMLACFGIGLLSMYLVMRAKPGRRLGFGGMLFVIMLSVFAPGMNAQTAHFITLTWNYTQGTTPAANFSVQRGATAGGTYTEILNVTLAANCAAAAGQPAGNFSCAANDIAALAAGTVSHYVVIAQDGATPPNQSGPSNDTFATWLGNPLAASGAAATSH